MLHLIVEELFSLGPHELGCLEDKDKPGAKVGCSTKCDDLSISMNEIHFPLFSVGPSHPLGVAEIVCLPTTGGPTERLHH